jgi:outer membrane protein OmpA-like peptidoglycan-associated protein/opacity protein-like surface antigen
MKKHASIALAVVLASVCLPVSAQQSQGKIGIGVFGSATKLVGDNHDQDVISPWIGLKLCYTADPNITLSLNGAYGSTNPRDVTKTGLSKYTTKAPGTPFKTTLLPVLADVQVNFLPERRLNPYLTWGMGLLFWDLTKNENSVHGSKTNVLADFGLGAEWFLVESLGLDLSLHYQHILKQKLDMSGTGDVQTGDIEVRLGLNLYFGGRRDSDGDGILDRRDACPKQAEDMDNFKDDDGCPDPDNDGDGILDAADKAPNLAEDIDGFQDQDGEPDPDNDGDGILDAADKAPNLAEDIDGFQDQDGAPDPDNDGDGIPDVKDKCPDKPETMNGFEDQDGCPDKKPEVVIQKEAPIVLEGVNFESGSSVLVPGAKAVLDKVVMTLKDHPQMRLEVRGHTDNQGKRAGNVKLSLRRAEAVKTYLTGKGIAADRIQTKGFGPDQPIAPNDNSEGRMRNRRIEFIRVD